MLERNTFIVLPIARLKPELMKNFSDAEYPFTVFLFRKDVPFDCDSKMTSFVARLTHVGLMNEHHFYVCVRILEDSDASTVFNKNLFVNNEFLNSSPVRFAAQVILRLVDEERPKPNALTLISNATLASSAAEDELIQGYKKYLEKVLGKQEFIVLNSDYIFELGGKETITVVFDSSYCIVDVNFLENCEFTADFEETNASDDTDEKNKMDYYEAVDESLLKDIVLAMEINLKFNTSENILIVGRWH